MNATEQISTNIMQKDEGQLSMPSTCKRKDGLFRLGDVTKKITGLAKSMKSSIALERAREVENQRISDAQISSYDRHNTEMFQSSQHVDIVRSHEQKSSSSEIIKVTGDNLNAAKRQKLSTNFSTYNSNGNYTETIFLMEARRQTFSNWPQTAKVSASQMIDAGFFSCNVSDRVICIYCELICQSWKDDADSPIAVHKTLAPYCYYINSILPKSESYASSTKLEAKTVDTTQLSINEVTNLESYKISYINIEQRNKTFTKWNNPMSLPTESLANTGLFYDDDNNLIKCFSCNGSFLNLTAKDDFLLEHVKRYPRCTYAMEMHNDRSRQQILSTSDHEGDHHSTGPLRNINQYRSQLDTPNIISRFVAARLDLFISQYLLDEGFSLSVIKRCFDDQLQNKKDDYANYADLFIACTILQKQISCINGNKDNIITPNIEMKLVHDGKKLVGYRLRKKLIKNSKSSGLQNQSDSTKPTVETALAPNNEIKPEVPKKDMANKESLSNPCAICEREEKQLACVPCGHLTLCTACGTTVRTCTTCGKSIEAFVRVFI